MDVEPFDIGRVHWEKNKFQPWYLKEEPFRIDALKLSAQEEMILAEVSGQVMGFLQREVVYHHIIQGQVRGVDFMLTFCGVCNAGVLLSPRLDRRLHHFREIGVYNGQQIFEDTETGSLWNHLTGECLYGEHQGKSLSLIGSLTQELFVDAKRKFPTLPVYVSGRKKIFRSIMRFVIRHILGKSKNWLPPHFAKTLPAVDARLPKMTMGLAVKVSKTIKFYPLEKIKSGDIEDCLDGESLVIRLDKQIPRATTANGNEPFQLFTRWYAFILTYPHGKLFGGE